jgi:MFS family permease
MNESYRALFARGQSRRLIVALSVAWLSFGMVVLAVFLTVHRADGSYALAGLAVAAFSVGSGVLAPFRGRLLDRRGVRPWLVVFASGYALALSALAVLADANAPTWLLILLAAAGGASAPPIVASLRARWPVVVEAALVRRAYALTSIVGDVGLVAAPVLAAVLFVAVPWLPLVACALFAVAAAVVVVRGWDRSADEQEHSGALLLSRGFVVLVVVELALGVALGLVEVAVPAAAARWGATAYSGVLLAAFAAGSVLGGLWFGRRRWRASAERRYLLAAALLAIALLPPLAANGPALLAALLLVAGLAYGPATISLFEALDDLTTARATEAFTWMTTSAAVGAAAGNALGGWIGLSAAFALASATLGTTAGAGLALVRPWRGVRSLRRPRTRRGSASA